MNTREVDPDVLVSILDHENSQDGYVRDSKDRARSRLMKKP